MEQVSRSVLVCAHTQMGTRRLAAPLGERKSEEVSSSDWDDAVPMFGVQASGSLQECARRVL